LARRSTANPAQTQHPAEVHQKRRQRAILLSPALEQVVARRFAVMVCSADNLLVQRGFVHTSGTEIVDGQGSPLTLRGINLAHWLDP